MACVKRRYNVKRCIVVPGLIVGAWIICEYNAQAVFIVALKKVSQKEHGSLPHYIAQTLTGRRTCLATVYLQF